MVRFQSTISLLKLYVSVRGNQPTLNNLKYMQLETSAFQIVHGCNSTFINTFDKPKELEQLTLAY